MKELISINIDEQRWRAIQRREMNGLAPFFYGVVTTGIYCRPTCPSKQPQRENVRIFETNAQAHQAGFRPCKRCQPDVAQDFLLQIVEQACETIAHSPKEASLKKLAEQAGFSSSHFHRLFKRVVGVTPKQYALQVQHQRVREALRTQNSVTEAMIQVKAVGSHSVCLMERRRLGMSPREYQQGGNDKRIRYALAFCDLGWLAMAATEGGICAIELGDSKEEVENRVRKAFPNAVELSHDPQLSSWLNNLLESIETPAASAQLPLNIRGSAFQMQVWQAVRQIPIGHTASYAEIARQIGSPRASRAVARACANNPTAIAIPCHRVIKADGTPGGYRWGVERKKRLLELEGKGSGQEG